MSELILMVVVIFVTAVAVHYAHLSKTLTARLVAAEQRITELEEANARHLPYRTADEIENALAALWKVRNESEVRLDLIDNSIAHMQLARSGNKK